MESSYLMFGLTSDLWRDAKEDKHHQRPETSRFTFYYRSCSRNLCTVQKREWWVRRSGQGGHSPTVRTVKTEENQITLSPHCQGQASASQTEMFTPTTWIWKCGWWCRRPGVGPELLYFSKLSGDADTAGPWITVWVAKLQAILETENLVGWKPFFFWCDVMKILLALKMEWGYEPRNVGSIWNLEKQSPLTNANVGSILRRSHLMYCKT